MQKKHDLLIGVAYRYTFYDDNTFATLTADGLKNKSSITHLPGIFLQDEIALNTQNKLLLGARWDKNSLHGTIFSPRLNYKWNSKDNAHIIRLSIGNGFRVSNIFTEDHAALTGAREVEFNGELDPETSWNGNINYVKKNEYRKFICHFRMQVLFIPILTIVFYLITRLTRTKSSIQI